MGIKVADFRDTKCPPDATLVLVDPPYNLKKNYLEGDDAYPYHNWVWDILFWSWAAWTVILGPAPTLKTWLPKVPEPNHILWWHQTSLLPGRSLGFYAPSITPILVYRQEGAEWYGPTRPTREFHDVIDAHSSMGDVTRLRKLGIKLPKHSSVTGTSLPKKIIPNLTKEGDLVVDPMAGVGSILVAAQRLGRETWGCDISQEYAEAGNRWLEAERGN